MAKDIIDQAIEQHLKNHARFCGAEGFSTSPPTAEAARSVWDQIRQAASDRGIGIVSLLSILGPILNMIFAGTPVGAILAQILALLNQPTPAA